MDVAATPPALDDARVRELRTQLPTLDTCAYLNAGTMGPMPRMAIDAMHAVLDREAHDRQPPTVWQELVAGQQAARAAAARLGGVDASQVALMHTTHAGINAALWGLGVAPGANVVTTDEEHFGLLIPLRALHERCGVEVRTVRWHRDPAALAAAVAEQVDDRTAAVALSHVSWVTGAVADLGLLREAAGRAALIVDGAQGAGAIDLAVGPGAADAYTISGQKWPLGPNGSGALLLADPERWLPTTPGHFSITEPWRADTAPWQPDGRRLEHSQEALLPLAGFAAAVTWLLDEVGIDQAAAHSRRMNARARELLAPVLTELAPSGDPQLQGDAHLLVAAVEPGTAEAVAAGLLERDVSIRNLGADTIRFSLGCWNTEADLLAARDALEDLVAAGMPTTTPP